MPCERQHGPGASLYSGVTRTCPAARQIDSEYVPPATAKPDIEIVEIDSPDSNKFPFRSAILALLSVQSAVGLASTRENEAISGMACRHIFLIRVLVRGAHPYTRISAGGRPVGLAWPRRLERSLQCRGRACPPTIFATTIVITITTLTMARGFRMLRGRGIDLPVQL